MNNAGQVVWSSNELDDIHDNIVNLYGGNSVVKLKPMVHNRNPMINSSGQVVWQGWDGNDDEIFLYANGRIIQITDNDVADELPQINDQGVIAWQGSDGNAMQIFTYANGAISQLTDNDLENSSPQIDNNGQVAWLARSASGDQAGIFRADAGSGRMVKADVALNLAPAPAALKAVVLAAAPKDPPLFSFVVLGDSRLSEGWGVAGENSKFPHEFLGYLSSKIKARQHKPEFVVFLGDMATYPYNGKNEWLSAWFDTFAKPLHEDGIKLYPVMGNHETFKWGSGAWQYDHTSFSLDRFRHYFDVYKGAPAKFLQKFKDPKGNTVMDDYSSYYWDVSDPKGVPNSRFFVVDFYSNKNPEGGDSGWIRQDLIDELEILMKDAHSRGLNIMVFGHTPLHTNDNINAKELQDLLFKYDARAYFAGHVHVYRHEVLGNSASEPVPKFFHEIVAGSAGADLSKAKSFDWVSAQKGKPLHPECVTQKDKKTKKVTLRCDAGAKFYSVAARYNYSVVDVYADEIIVKGYVTQDDDADLKKEPYMVEWEEFRIMKDGKNVMDQQIALARPHYLEKKLFKKDKPCEGKSNPIQPCTYRTDLIWADTYQD